MKIQDWIEKGKPINNIICCDCLDAMKQIDDNSVDCVITSPPYNLNDKRYYANYQDCLTSEQYVEWLNKISKELFRIVKPNANILFNISYNSNSKFEYIKIVNNFIDNGFKLCETMVWIKKGMPLTEINNLTRDFEFIFLFCKDKKYFTNQKKNQIISNVIKISNSNTQIDINNACFPKELINKLLKYFSKENDLILDLFMGSGTVAVSCKEMKRNYLGFEIDEQQILISQKRLNSIPEKLEKWFN